LCGLLILHGYVFGSSKDATLLLKKCMFGLRLANTSLNQKYVLNLSLIENISILWFMFEIFLFKSEWNKICLDRIDKKNTCTSCCSCKIQIKSTFTLKPTWCYFELKLSLLTNLGEKGTEEHSNTITNKLR